MNSLTTKSWQAEVDELLEKIIGGVHADSVLSEYLASRATIDDIRYQITAVKNIYADRVALGCFDINQILEDLYAHDEALIDEATDIVTEHCFPGDEDNPDTFWSKIKRSLMCEAGIDLWLENEAATNSDIPAIIVYALKDSYYEFSYPVFGQFAVFSDSYSIKKSDTPMIYGVNDCQNILFDDMVTYDWLYGYGDAPINCRVDRNRLKGRLMINEHSGNGQPK